MIEYHPARKREMKSTDECYNVDEPQNHYAPWKVSQKKANVMIHLCEMSRIGESIATESRLVVARGWGIWGQTRSDSLWIGFLGGDENIFLTIKQIISPSYKYT